MARVEYCYDTIVGMALRLRNGIWIKESGGNEVNEQRVIDLFTAIIHLSIGREASGALGFNPDGGFEEIDVFENQDGATFNVRTKRSSLECLLVGLWEEIDGQRLYLDTRVVGIGRSYFKFMSAGTKDYVSVTDIINGKVPAYPNVKRLVNALCSVPFVYCAHLIDPRGIGLLDYPEDLRNRTIRDAMKLG